MNKRIISKCFIGLLIGSVLTTVLYWCGFTLSSPIPSIRCQIVSNLTDQSVLTRIANKDPNSEVRRNAVMRIIDQVALTKVATDERDPDVRVAVFQRLTDQKALVTIAKDNSIDSEVRILAVAKLLDQDLLSEVVMMCRVPSVGSVALSKLFDQEILGNVAIWARSDQLCSLAVKKLTDQNVLVEVAFKGRSKEDRDSAFEKLTDENALALMAESLDSNVRSLALQKINSQTLLTALAIKSTHSDVRSNAFSRLFDQTALANVAIKSPNDEVHDKAVRKLTDHATLAKVVIESQFRSTRNYAFKQIDNENILTKLATSPDLATQMNASILLQVRYARKSLPDAERSRLCEKILDIVSVLTDLAITEELGNIQVIECKWERISAFYEIAGMVFGESVTLDVKFSKDNRFFTHTWAKMPGFLNAGLKSGAFVPAEIYPEDFLKVIPESVATKITRQFTHRPR